MSENLPPGFVSVADYIAELRRDPEHAKALDEAREPVLRDIIRALLDRLADRDALAERCEKLHEALRRNAVKDGYCAECSERPDWRTWVGTNPERHAEGCLAAPKDAP